jgi:hypothetical protein
MEPCTQEERIGRIEDAVEKIGGQVQTLLGDFQLLRSKVEDALQTVAEHDRALKGNNGTIGLIAKVANALDVLSDLQEALRGKGEKPGLIATIDRLVKITEEWADTRKWVSRLIWGWVITTLLMLLLELVKR